jgi:UDP-N-acetylmuramate dehydrogenase
MNAGSVEEWIGQIVSTVLVLLPEGGLKRYSAAELDWAYRSSGLPLGEVILEAELMVSQGNASHIRARMEGVMKRRQKSQPLNKPNAGSIFRNPPEGSAGQLIDSLGLKGLSSGDASISEKHANFIVNNGRASAADVLSLIQEVVKKVRDSYGLELQTEIRFIGF